MATNNMGKAELFAVDSDNTIQDIWKYSQKQDDKFDPRAMNEQIDMQRGFRKEIRKPERFSFGSNLMAESPIVREAEVSRAMKRRSTNINLQKSIQLLDDAVGIPGSLQHSARKTPSQLKHSMYTPIKVAPSSEFDVSASFGPSASLLQTPASKRATFGDTSRLDITGMKRTAEEMDADVVTTNVDQLLEEDSQVGACGAIYGDFMQSMRSSPAQHQVFQLVQQYEQICSDNVELLRRLMKQTVPRQNKFMQTLEMLEALREERSTWSLLDKLYADRLAQEANSCEEPMVVDTLGKYQTDNQIMKSLYERESSVRQAQLVIDWLEQNAAQNLEDYYEKVDFFTDDMGAWENTLHTLKQKRRGEPVLSERAIVTELDPDAPCRQKRPLADLDMEDEARLLKYIFFCVRTGALETAQNVCLKVGQAWRAATLEGWRLYHDPNYDGLAPGGAVLPVEGNPQRDVWKAVCWRMADEDKLNMHERAIYAAFSGHLEALLPACRSWEDFLWAYFRVMVDQQVEQEIRFNATSRRPLEPLPQCYGDKMISLESIFNDIQACPLQDVRQQASSRFSVIQKFIIIGDTDSLIEEMFEWCKDEVNRPSPHLTRFMAHLVLFFRVIEVSTKEELCVSILESYVKLLIEDRQLPLVATYVAALPLELQIEWYAKFLEGIWDTEERKACLALAQEAGLDIPSTTKLVVENIRSRDMHPPGGGYGHEGQAPPEGAISDEDRQKVEAIDWLVFDPCQRAEALRQANALMRNFLATGKLNAAREVFNKIPPGSIDVIVKVWKAQTGSTELCGEDDNAVREYLCHQSYLDAQDSFNDWFEHYHNARPAKPDAPAGANFTERVAFEHREKQYQMEFDRWQHSLKLQTKATADKIYNVLLFVDGGWMVDQRADGPRDQNRSHQLLMLRQLCLPSITLLLHTVLHTTQRYTACLKLADVIASEQHQLFKVFGRTELQKFLHRVRESSVALLDNKTDPLGYPLTTK